jgi:predicted RNase H-like HicB family nuclease
MKLNVVVSRLEGEDLYVAQCVEVDVASQGDTIEDAVQNVKEAIALYFDAEDNSRLPRPSMKAELRRVDIRHP